MLITQKNIFLITSNLEVFCQNVSKLTPDIKYQFIQAHLKIDSWKVSPLQTEVFGRACLKEVLWAKLYLYLEFRD